MSKTKRSKGAPSSLLLPQTGICFLPDVRPQTGQAPVCTAFPAAQSSAANISLSITRGSGKERKIALYPQIHYI